MGRSSQKCSDGRIAACKQGMGIRLILKYLAIVAIVIVAAPINKQVDQIEPETVTVRYQPQLIQEMPEPETVKAEVVTEISTPKQNIPKKGCEAYRDEVAKYDWNVNLMLAIAKAESGCNTNAVGDNYPIRGLHAPSCGLFQIRTLASRPSCAALQDPAVNVSWAYKIYQGQGLKAWTVYTKGLYKKYL